MLGEEFLLKVQHQIPETVLCSFKISVNSHIVFLIFPLRVSCCLLLQLFVKSMILNLFAYVA